MFITPSTFGDFPFLAPLHVYSRLHVYQRDESRNKKLQDSIKYLYNFGFILFYVCRKNLPERLLREFSKCTATLCRPRTMFQFDEFFLFLSANFFHSNFLWNCVVVPTQNDIIIEDAMVFDLKNQTLSYFILCLQEKFAGKAIARTGRFQSAQRLCVGRDSGSDCRH